MKILLSFFFYCFIGISNKGLSDASYTYVWVCMGKSAYSYHCNSCCKGLNRCKASIKRLTLEKARSMKRTPCDICYK